MLFTIPLAIVYVLLAIAMPRSGGDYVWITRGINGALGFISGWSLWIAFCAIIGTIAFINSTVVLPISMVIFGYSLGNQGLVGLASTVATPVNGFLLALALIIFCSLVAGLNPRIFGRAMSVLFVLIVLGAILSVYVLATSSHADFVNVINGYGGTNMTYDGIIAEAQASGWAYAPISVSATFASIPLGFFLWVGMNFCAPAAGEIRNVRRSMGFAILGALFVAWIVNVIGTQLSVNVVGYEFTQAAFAVGSKWPLAAPPWMPLFVSMLTRNSIVLVFIQIGWLLTFVWGISGYLLASTRYVFAFSFDRAFPVLFADISDRFHFPVKAAILNTVCSTIFLVLASFTSLIGLLLNSTVILGVVWFLGSAAAVILPFRKKELMKPLPGSSWKIPLTSIIGFISMVLMAIIVYFGFVTPSMGPSTPQALFVLVMIYVLGLVVYFVSSVYNKRHGVDLKLVYSEIPPE
jgi:amino acid transporter